MITNLQIRNVGSLIYITNINAKLMQSILLE